MFELFGLELTTILIICGVGLACFLLGFCVAKRTNVSLDVFKALADVGLRLVDSLKDGKLSDEEKSQIIFSLRALFKTWSEKSTPVKE